MASFHLTPARSPDDFKIIANLFLAYAQSLPINLDYQDFEAELADLPGKYAPPEGELLLARATDGEILGCVGLRAFTDDACEMKRLYVLPQARGMGVGEALVSAIITCATEAGYRRMLLDTLPEMKGAIRLYEKADFVPITAYYDTPISETLFFQCLLGDNPN